MLETLSSLLLHWAVTTLSLWAASHVFRGVRFAGLPSLLVSGLLLGVVNSVVRPLLIIITLPITVITLGLFLLVINALMLLLVASLVRGFTLSGFWTAFFAGAFIALLSFAADSWLASDGAPSASPTPIGNGRTIEARDADRAPQLAPRKPGHYT